MRRGGKKFGEFVPFRKFRRFFKFFSQAESQPDLIKSIEDNNHESDIGIPKDVEEKIINQVRTETSYVAAKSSAQLSFDSATSAIVDIIGDFGREVEKEIGLIVSGYLDNDKSVPTSPNDPIRPRRNSNNSLNNSSEKIFDENKFLEHVKHFSKVSNKLAIFLLLV